MGAAEVLHRGLPKDKDEDEKPFPVEEFKKIRKKVLDQVPEEYRDKFKEMIRNEPTLRNRLCALAKRVDSQAITDLLPDIDYWAKRTTQARNKLVHEGRTPEQSMDELLAIVETTTAVLILNILKELGLPADQQRRIVQDFPQFRQASERANKWLRPPEAKS